MENNYNDIINELNELCNIDFLISQKINQHNNNVNNDYINDNKYNDYINDNKHNENITSEINNLIISYDKKCYRIKSYLSLIEKKYYDHKNTLKNICQHNYVIDYDYVGEKKQYKCKKCNCYK